MWAACSRTGATTTTIVSGDATSTSIPGSTSLTSLPALEGDLPFSVWEEIRAAVRASPDHLPARAANLVAAGDPASLYEFVRDEIVTYPPRVDSLTASDTTIRWGTRATLRGGAGTPREKADLLADRCYRPVSRLRSGQARPMAGSIQSRCSQ